MLRCILVLTLVATTWAQQQNRCKGFHLLSTSNESPSNVGDEVAFASTVLPGFVDSERSATLKLKFVRFQPRTWSRYLFNSAFSRNVDAKISLYSGREEKLYEREMTILEREDVTYEQFNTDDVDLRMSVARLDSKISYMTVAKLRDSCGRGFWMTYVVSLVLNQETYDGAVLAQLDLSYGAKLHQSLAAPLVLFQGLFSLLEDDVVCSSKNRSAASRTGNVPSSEIRRWFTHFCSHYSRLESFYVAKRCAGVTECGGIHCSSPSNRSVSERRLV